MTVSLSEHRVQKIKDTRQLPIKEPILTLWLVVLLEQDRLVLLPFEGIADLLLCFLVFVFKHMLPPTIPTHTHKLVNFVEVNQKLN